MLYKGKRNNKHIKYILKNLRAEDRRELEAKYGKKYLKFAYKNISNVDVTILYKDKTPVLMYGVHPQEMPSRSLGGYKKEYAGVVWLLSTDEIYKNKIYFLREAKKTIIEWAVKFRMLCNAVHKENFTAISWLKWLGFEFKPYTENFMFFYKETD